MSVVARMDPASSPFKRVLRGTSQARAAKMPSAAAIQEVEFGAQIATRSPGRTPRAMRLRATASIAFSTSAKVTRWSPSTKATRRPRWAETALTIRGTVPYATSQGSGRSTTRDV